MKLESDTCTLIPPLFQPLRLWTPRVLPAIVASVGAADNRTSSKAALQRTFSMRGGFVTTDGERRMVIAGKLFRSRG